MTSFPFLLNLLFYLAATFATTAVALSFLSLLKSPHPLHPLVRIRAAIAASKPWRCTTPLAFSSLDSISEWLKPRLPSDALTSWGITSGTKTLRNLWLELPHSETSLLSDEEGSSSLPLCATHVTTIHVCNPHSTLLIESRQLLFDGTIRPHRRPLSKKSPKKRRPSGCGGDGGRGRGGRAPTVWTKGGGGEEGL